MDNELDLILGRIKTHFTPSEFIDFLGLDWDDFLDDDKLKDVMEERLEEIKEEIGID